jgi:hypothetical protein
MTQFVAKSAKSVTAFISATTHILRSVVHFPETLADAIERLARGE